MKRQKKELFENEYLRKIAKFLNLDISSWRKYFECLIEIYPSLKDGKLFISFHNDNFTSGNLFIFLNNSFIISPFIVKNDEYTFSRSELLPYNTINGLSFGHFDGIEITLHTDVKHILRSDNHNIQREQIMEIHKHLVKAMKWA